MVLYNSFLGILWNVIYLIFLSLLAETSLTDDNDNESEQAGERATGEYMYDFPNHTTPVVFLFYIL